MNALNILEPKGEFEAMLKPFERMVGLQRENLAENGETA